MRAPRLARPRTSTALAGAAALLAVSGAGYAYAADRTTVAVRVDGATRSVTTHGDTVADVLRAAHLRVGEHDVLAPAADRPVDDGALVVLRRGRPLSLSVDGVQRTVWVTADDVDEALGEVGLRVEGAALSASRSRPIGLEGLSLDVRLPKTVTIAVDGRTEQRTTTAATVADLLAEAGVALRPQDVLDRAPTGALKDGGTVRVIRVDSRTDVQDVPAALVVRRTPDASAYAGTERVVEAGRAGVTRRTYAVTTRDGVEVERTLVSEAVAVAPADRVVAVGTKPKPAPAPRPAAVSGGSGGGLNWAALARCESGGNPRAVSGNGLYYGLYQFSDSTWRGVGGSGHASSASPAEQTQRAQVLYSRTGRSSWPVCGRYL